VRLRAQRHRPRLPHLRQHGRTCCACGRCVGSQWVTFRSRTSMATGRGLG
jgi:hypothetical protein